MLYNQRPQAAIIFMPPSLRYYMENQPIFDENEIELKKGEIFTDLYYPQDPNIIQGRYKVSNMGRIYDTYTKSFISNTFHKGYEACSLSTVNSENKVEMGQYRVNRVILSSFHPNENMSNLHVHHKNNIPCDNRLENLDWATPEENTQYAVGDGRFQMISKKEQLSPELAEEICKSIKDGKSPEEVGVMYSVNDRLIYKLVSGEIFPYLPVKYDLPEIKNKYKTKSIAKDLSHDLVKLIKKDIVDGMSEIDIINKYHQPRHVISDIRHGRNYKDVDIGVELPKIEPAHLLNPELADDIGKLISEGKSNKEVAEISGFDKHTIVDIKRGTKYPEVKQKYHLDDVKQYSDTIPDEVVLKEVIPAILSGKYSGDGEVARVFGCSTAQIRDLRHHDRRKHLTEGVDFDNCYKPKKRERRTDEDIIAICDYIQANPKLSYNQIAKDLESSVPSITYKLVQDLKLRKTHKKITDNYTW